MVKKSIINMDHFLFNYNGNKYRETKKSFIGSAIHNELKINDNDIIIEPFCGIFGFSRALFEDGFRGKFILNDVDKYLINEYRMMKEDLSKYIDDLKKEFAEFKEHNKEKIKKIKISGVIDDVYEIKGMNVSKKISIIGRTFCESQFSTLKFERKIKNFELKKDVYIEFLKHCEFYDCDCGDFLKIYKADEEKRTIFYYDPPYFDSINTSYSTFSNIVGDKSERYIDNSVMYGDILNNHIDAAQSKMKIGLFVMNRLYIFDMLIKKCFPDMRTIEGITGCYNGTIMNKNKNKKKKKNKKDHIIYLFGSTEPNPPN